MKKTSLLFSAAILSSLFLGTGSAFAVADGPGSPDVPAHGEGSIGFTENTGPTGPVDPTDPSKPDPTGPDGENENTDADGPLSLDVYPSKFEFGLANPVDMKENTYASSVTGNHFLQVTDNRSDADGWSVTVARSEFTLDGGTDELTGSIFTLPLATAVGRNALSAIPVDADSTLTTAGVDTAIPVGDGNAVTIFGADGTANVGKSTSTYTWDATKETLTVKQNTAKKGTFKSTVNWTITATPAS